MTVPSESRFPRLRRQEHEPHVPTQLEYVRIAVFLAVLTAIEVGLYYLYDSVAKALLIAILVLLAALKFSTVVAFFMHLRFDGRLLTYIFLLGLALAWTAFFVVIITLHGMG